MSTSDLQILTAAIMVSSSCALLGCFLVLRKMAMVGDAISHAILPGIVIAFLLSGSRDSLTMVAGAGTIGLFTTFMVEYLHRRARLQSDAAIGVTFTALFALGVILVSAYAGKVDLDQECVLYGEIAYVPLDVVYIGDSGLMVPRAILVSGIVLALITTFVTVGFRPLALTTFDPAFAQAAGVQVVLWHYVLMGAVSVTTVASFESVGAILVVALLVGPAATAYLLTDKLKSMLWISVVIGAAASVLGYLMAVAMDGSIAGGIAASCGLLFLLAMLFSPYNGLAWKKRRRVTGPASV